MAVPTKAPGVNDRYAMQKAFQDLLDAIADIEGIDLGDLDTEIEALQTAITDHEALDASDAVHGLAVAAAIADASEAHTTTDPPTKAEAEAALNALGGTINEIIAALVGAGIVAAE